MSRSSRAAVGALSQCRLIWRQDQPRELWAMSQTGHGTASAEPNALGIDHDAGRFDIAREDGRVVIDATRKHLRLNGKPVRQPVTCRTGHWAGVRLVYDPTLERFDIDRALPSTIVGVAAFHTRHRF